MGLILPQTVKIRTGSSNYKHYREKGYWFKKCGDFIEVNVLDLHPGSTVKVKVVCDICGKEREMWYRTVIKCNEENELITCASNSCKHKKYEDTCMKKYGVKSAIQSQEIQNKIKTTNLERYGCENAMQNKEIQNKVRETNLERYGHACSLQNKEIQNKSKETCIKKYGVDNPSKAQEIKNKKIETCKKNFGCEYPAQSKIVQDKLKKTFQNHFGCDSPMQCKVIQDKMKATCKERYGVENVAQSKVIQDKMKATCKERYGVENGAQSEVVRNKMKATCKERYGVEYAIQNKAIQDRIKTTCKERYGVENAMQNEEIKNKALDSFQFNGTGPSSRAQRYINYISNGTLNKHICSSLVDIYMEKENIVIEYDGSGHFLNDIINGNAFPTKDSLLREKEREDSIVNKGYKVIRFIATKDRIPSDEVILNLINEFKNSDFKVIRINFEEGTIEKDYNEKTIHDFGILRKITQKDLEQFESKK